MNGDTPTVFSKNAIASIPWLLLGRVISFALYLVASVVIVRSMSVSSFGEYSFLLSSCEWLAIPCALGLNYALLRFIPELVQEGQSQKIKRLFFGTFFMQLAVLGVVSFALWSNSLLIERRFSLQVGSVSWAPFTLLLALLAKEWINNAMTALYKTKLLSLFSMLQSVVFLGALLLLDRVTPHAVLICFSGSILLSCFLGFCTIVKALVKIKTKDDKSSFTFKRLLSISLPYAFTRTLSRLFEQYSEVFFLGFFATAAVVGHYSLGLFVPHIAITFIPFTLYTLFTTAVSEAYAKDESSFERSVEGIYQILIFVVVPIAVFGALFSENVIVWVWGEKMQPASLVATFFFIFKSVALVFVPLSVALTVKERLYKMMPLEIATVILNLILDVYFIKHYGMLGAVSAIVFTFLLTAPLKLLWIRSIVGGLFFPTEYFVRYFIACLSCGLITFALFRNLEGAFVLGALALFNILFIGALRYLPVIKEQDVLPFKEVGLVPLNRILEWVVHE